jgi:hypothetical protein
VFCLCPPPPPLCRYELPDEDLKGRLELKFFENVGKGVSSPLLGAVLLFRELQDSSAVCCRQSVGFQGRD